MCFIFIFSVRLVRIVFLFHFTTRKRREVRRKKKVALRITSNRIIWMKCNQICPYGAISINTAQINELITVYAKNLMLVNCTMMDPYFDDAHKANCIIAVLRIYMTTYIQYSQCISHCINSDLAKWLHQRRKIKFTFCI